MNAELFQRVTREGGSANLSDCAKFHLTGADCVRYLNGQVTQDVRKATATTAVHACVTNLKGRIEGDVFIRRAPEADGGGLWLDAAADLREPLAMRLEKYIVADDVELRDVTDDWQLWHVFGPAAAEQPPDGAVSCSRYGAAGYDLWLPASAPQPQIAAPLLTAGDLGGWRIIAGIPQSPQELNNEAFPQEAGLEKSAMDFAKGCYLGQEILSRIKTSGKMPRRLVRFVVVGNAPAPEPGAKLGERQEDGAVKEVGHVTSVTHHPVLDRTVGLAYVRQGWEGKHSLLLASTDLLTIPAEVEISLI